jgi:Terminase large subunit, T4likevirus-type, N-terminal
MSETLEKLRARKNTRVIGPQPGPQTEFLSTQADIAVYGGSAGGGKSYALLLEPLRHITNPNFGAVYFRRTSVQVRNEGGLWDESIKLYPFAGGKPREHDLWWRFPSGASVSFAHLEHEKNVYDWQGSQIPLICFDEITHFTESQFWYLISRNRSTCGVKPYVRCTCNPDADSWVAQLVEWYINPDTGYAIPERSGVLRWFIRLGEKIIWADSPEELSGYTNPMDGETIPPKSFTFIRSKLTDNQALMNADPGYLANLLALPLVERERLLNGNWKIRHTGQAFFDIGALLINAQPVVPPPHCDAIYAILDTASKSGTEHDGTAVIWCAKTQFSSYPLIILDWEILQIDGALLEKWLPSVFTHGEALAERYKARAGFIGAWIEDKASGIILIQQARRRNLNVRPIDSKLTALGKDERAISVSGYVSMGKVKISEEAYHKTMTYKGVTKNHLISQVELFSIGDKDNTKRADDLLDDFTYMVALGLGDKGGF